MSTQLDRQDRTDVASERPLAHRSSAMHDFVTIAGRAIRSVFREPEFMIPALIVPVFFYVVNVGALQDFAEQSDRLDRVEAKLSQTEDRLTETNRRFFALLGYARELVLDFRRIAPEQPVRQPPEGIREYL